jgi:hypothetical protein
VPRAPSTVQHLRAEFCVHSEVGERVSPGVGVRYYIFFVAHFTRYSRAHSMTLASSSTAICPLQCRSRLSQLFAFCFSSHHSCPYCVIFLVSRIAHFDLAFALKGPTRSASAKLSSQRNRSSARLPAEACDDKLYVQQFFYSAWAALFIQEEASSTTSKRIASHLPSFCT